MAWGRGWGGRGRDEPACVLPSPARESHGTLLRPSPSLTGGQPANHPCPNPSRAWGYRSPGGSGHRVNLGICSQSPSLPCPSGEREEPSSASSGLTGRLLWASLGGLLPKDTVSTIPFPTPRTTAESLVTKPLSHKPLSGLPR